MSIGINAIAGMTDIITTTAGTGIVGIETGVGEKTLVMRMTGCASGCTWGYVA